MLINTWRRYSILFQCNFFIGVLTTSVIALGNISEYESDTIRYALAIADNSKTETVYTLTPEEKVVNEAEKSSLSDKNTDESVQEQSMFNKNFDSSFKAYMDYRCITDTSSVQYQLQEQAYTDERGFRRISDDYCVALGTGITNGCGERFKIYLDTGYSFTAIVSDIKADAHTDSTNCYVPRGNNSGNVVEFIIDSDYASSSMLSSGNVGYYDDLSGNITAIEPI